MSRIARARNVLLGRPRVAAPSMPALPDLIYFLDVYWIDASGIYLQGWAMVERVPLDAVAVRIGSREVVAKRSARPDLLPHYPAAVDTARAGFTVYVPGPPGDVSLVGILTNGGEISTRVSLPDHPLPVVSGESQFASPDFDVFPGAAPDGPVLAIGIRSATQETLDARLSIMGDREVVGFDIHPGLGVDIVGDAHRLSSYFPPNHFAAVFSASVLEHLTAPWLYAAECAKVLMPGGRMLHQVPWAWPTHAQPNDFWRMSSGALDNLFGAMLGMRVLSSGSVGTAVITPTPAWRDDFITMPTTESAMGSWIHAEKIDDRARDISWPYDEEAGAATATEYPVDGLANLERVDF
ncbi:MAG TPA: methyltransferase domain-containing protein [Galbitalea sp.]|nr:methyltransferase domain-containing protein [Galbitalea sp.]